MCVKIAPRNITRSACLWPSETVRFFSIHFYFDFLWFCFVFVFFSVLFASFFVLLGIRTQDTLQKIKMYKRKFWANRHCGKKLSHRNKFLTWTRKQSKFFHLIISSVNILCFNLKDMTQIISLTSYVLKNLQVQVIELIAMPFRAFCQHGLNCSHGMKCLSTHLIIVT